MGTEGPKSTDPVTSLLSDNPNTGSVNSKKPHFNWDEPKLYEHWTEFRRRIGMISRGDPVWLKLNDTGKINTMLSWMGSQGFRLLFQLYPTEDVLEKAKFEDVLKQLDEHFRPSQNASRHCIQFFSCWSSQYKNFDSFHAAARELAAACDFGNTALAGLLMAHQQDDTIQQALIEETKSKITLEEVVRISKKVEAVTKAKEDSKTLQVRNNKAVEAVETQRGRQTSRDKGRGQNSNTRSRSRGQQQNRPSSQNSGGGRQRRPCWRCGKFHDFGRCPAFNKNCHKCNTTGHYSSMCQSSNQNQQRKTNRQINEVRQDYDDYQDSDIDSITIQPNPQAQEFHFDALKLRPTPQKLYTTQINSTEFQHSGDIHFRETYESPTQVLTTLKCQQAYNRHETKHKPALPEISVTLKADSGAESNLIPLRVYQSIYPGEAGMKSLEGTKNNNVRLISYSKGQIQQYGRCLIRVRTSQAVKVSLFYVVSDEFRSILGLQDCIALKILTVNTKTTNTWINSIAARKANPQDGELKTPIGVSTGKGTSAQVESRTLQPDELPEVLTKESIVTNGKLRHLFTGVGRFSREPAKITLREGARPIQKPARRVPIAMQQKFREELDSMEKQGIISKYDQADFAEAPQWLNSFVTVKKPSGKIRVCLDPTDLNKEIIRPVCNSNTLDDIQYKLRNAKYFAIFDATKGFFHVPLDEESKKLTAMLTPFGIYYYNVLAMGLANATDIFERCMRDTLTGLDGVTNIADDVCVYGSTYPEFRNNVVNFLNRCVEKDLHLNADKVQVNVSSVPFFGMMLTKDGLQPDPSKVSQVKNWPVPTNLTELQSFLGAVNYLQRFMPHLASLREPLGSLLKKDVEYIWTSHHQKAFELIKNCISESTVLKFFDPSKPVFIECDASKKGIGAVLLQPADDNYIRYPTDSDQIPSNLKPVLFSSKSLTSTESNYSNIERELLGVVHSCLHFKHFVYGTKFTIITDHKPLVTLFQKNVANISPRLGRMLLKILDYSPNVVYKQGRKMFLSDYLSRLSSHDPSQAKTIPGMDISVHALEAEVVTPLSTVNLQDIAAASSRCETHQRLKRYISDGFPPHSSQVPDDVRKFFTFRDELSVSNGLLLKGHQVLIPDSLKARILHCLHQSHQGICKTITRAKCAVYWPGMAKDIEENIGQCRECAENQPQQQHEKNKADIVATQPWQYLSIDNFEHDGKLFLMVLCRFSGYFVVRQVKGLTARETANAFFQIFSEHGIPLQIRADQGRNFCSQEFRSVMQQLGIELSFSSAGHHQSNPAERAIRTVKQMMKKSPTNWRISLLEYLATPVSSTLPSPATLMGRTNFKGLLPLRSEISEFANEMRAKKELSQAHYSTAGKNLRSVPIGTKVSYQDLQSSVWKFGKVIDIRGQSYVIQAETGREITRNRVHIRPTNVSLQSRQEPTMMPTRPITRNMPPRENAAYVPPTFPTNAYQHKSAKILPPLSTTKTTRASTRSKRTYNTKSHLQTGNIIQPSTVTRVTRSATTNDNNTRTTRSSIHK